MLRLRTTSVIAAAWLGVFVTGANADVQVLSCEHTGAYKQVAEEFELLTGEKVIVKPATPELSLEAIGKGQRVDLVWDCLGDLDALVYENEKLWRAFDVQLISHIPDPFRDEKNLWIAVAGYYGVVCLSAEAQGDAELLEALSSGLEMLTKYHENRRAQREGSAPLGLVLPNPMSSDVGYNWLSILLAPVQNAEQAALDYSAVTGLSYTGRCRDVERGIADVVFTRSEDAANSQSLVFVPNPVWVEPTVVAIPATSRLTEAQIESLIKAIDTAPRSAELEKRGGYFLKKISRRCRCLQLKKRSKKGWPCARGALDAAVTLR